MSNESVLRSPIARLGRDPPTDLSVKYLGPRKTETFRQKQDPCIFGPISGQNVVLARAISRNGGFNTGGNRGFWGVLEI